MAQDELSFASGPADEEAVRIRPVYLPVLSLVLVVGGPSDARADRVVNADEPIVVSDDVSNRIRIVHSSFDVPLPAEATGGESPEEGDPAPRGSGDPGTGGSGSGGNDMAPPEG